MLASIEVSIRGLHARQQPRTTTKNRVQTGQLSNCAVKRMLNVHQPGASHRFLRLVGLGHDHPRGSVLERYFPWG
jgi:hypothetical protein